LSASLLKVRSMAITELTYLVTGTCTIKKNDFERTVEEKSEDTDLNRDCIITISFKKLS